MKGMNCMYVYIVNIMYLDGLVGTRVEEIATSFQGSYPVVLTMQV